MKWQGPRRVSFTEEATVLGDVSPIVCSWEQGTSMQLVPAVTEEDVIAPVGGGSARRQQPLLVSPPPSRVSRRSLGRSTMGIWTSTCRVFLLMWIVGHLNVTSSSSSTTPGCSDISDSVGLPEVQSLVSPRMDVCSDRSADVAHLVSPLPSVGSPFVPDKLWGPVAPQLPVVDDRRTTPVPRWRLAREGPFLEERSPQYIRNTTYRDLDYNILYRSRGRRRISSSYVSVFVTFRRKRWRRVPLALVSAVLLCRWRRWGCGVHPWIRCSSIRRWNYIGLVLS